jgi:hypothetical protein
MLRNCLLLQYDSSLVFLANKEVNIENLCLLYEDVGYIEEEKN